MQTLGYSASFFYVNSDTTFNGVFESVSLIIFDDGASFIAWGFVRP